MKIRNYDFCENHISIMNIIALQMKTLICRSWGMNFRKFSRTFSQWPYLPKWLIYRILWSNEKLKILKLAGCKMSSRKLMETRESHAIAWGLKVLFWITPRNEFQGDDPNAGTIGSGKLDYQNPFFLELVS